MKNTIQGHSCRAMVVVAILLVFCFLGLIAYATEVPLNFKDAFAPEKLDLLLGMEPKQARIFRQDSIDQASSYTIDKGSADQLQSGMAVISTDGLVGYISEVQEKTATVNLLIQATTANAFSVYVDASREVGTIKNNQQDTLGGTCLRFVNLNPKTEVVTGETLYTEGADIYPSGIKVGQVGKVIEVAGVLEGFTVQPVVDFSTLETVWILLGSIKN